MEEIIRDYGNSQPDFKSSILRYFGPVGAHSSGEIGEDPVNLNLVPFVCQVATGKISKLGVFGIDYPTHDGTAIRDYLHVVDLADAHVKALEFLDKKEESSVCNLGTGHGVSVLEVISTFGKVTGRKIPLKHWVGEREMYAKLGPTHLWRKRFWGES